MENLTTTNVPENGKEDLFGVVDYLVLSLMLLISSMIGIYYRLTGGQQKTNAEYLLADRNMATLPVAFSLMASFMSAISLMGLTREIYMYGTQFIAINIGYIIGTPLSAYIFLPVFFRLQSPSAYGYLEKRFNLSTRVIASLAFNIQMTLYMAIVLYAPAIALEAVTGLSYLASVLSVGLVCTFYSAVGGMKAVLINDVFQSFLMFGSIISVIIAGSVHVGSIGTALTIASKGDRLHLFDFDLDPTVRHTFWSQVVGGTFLYVSLYGVNQTQVQRLLTVRDLKSSQRALWIQWPILACLSLLTTLGGIYMYAFYVGCDPVTSKRIARPDQILPLIVVDTMSTYPGLSGIFVAGIFSGSLSTVSSAINSLAAVTLEDYIKPFRKSVLSEARSTLILKVIAISYGLLSVILTFIVDLLGPSVLQASLAVFGMVGGPLLGLFTLGMCVPAANTTGALSGFISSVLLLFWMSFGQPRPKVGHLPLSTDQCPTTLINGTYIYSGLSNEFNFTATATAVDQDDQVAFLHKISYAWYTLIGWMVVMIVGTLISLIRNLIRPVEPVDSDLLIDPIRNYRLKNLRQEVVAEEMQKLNKIETDGPRLIN